MARVPVRERTDAPTMHRRPRPRDDVRERVEQLLARRAALMQRVRRQPLWPPKP